MSIKQFFKQQVYGTRKQTLIMSSITGFNLAMFYLLIRIGVFVLQGERYYGIDLPNVWYLDSIKWVLVFTMLLGNFLHEKFTVNENKKEPILVSAQIINLMVSLLWGVTFNSLLIPLVVALWYFIVPDDAKDAITKPIKDKGKTMMQKTVVYKIFIKIKKRLKR